MKTNVDTLREDLYEAATAAEAAVIALRRLATCGAELGPGPCRCTTRVGDNNPPELEKAVQLYERILGAGRGAWEPPDTGCYWAHAAWVWRKRCERLDAAANALAAL